MRKMGATYAIPYPVIVRSSFGMLGSYPAICIRGMLTVLTSEDVPLANSLQLSSLPC